MDPVRLAKREEPKPMNFLPTNFLGKLAFILMLILAMFIFLGLCFIVKGPTFGYL